MEKLLFLAAGIVAGGVFVFLFFRKNKDKEKAVNEFVEEVKKRLP